MRERLTKNTIGIRSSKEAEKMGTDVAGTGVVAYAIQRLKNMAINPMHQFNVYRIGPEIKLGEIDISFTNSSLFMVISSLTILILFNILVILNINSLSKVR